MCWSSFTWVIAFVYTLCVFQFSCKGSYFCFCQLKKHNLAAVSPPPRPSYGCSNGCRWQDGPSTAHWQPAMFSQVSYPLTWLQAGFLRGQALGITGAGASSLYWCGSGPPCSSSTLRSASGGSGGEETFTSAEPCSIGAVRLRVTLNFSMAWGCHMGMHPPTTTTTIQMPLFYYCEVPPNTIIGRLYYLFNFFIFVSSYQIGSLLLNTSCSGTFLVKSWLVKKWTFPLQLMHCNAPQSTRSLHIFSLLSVSLPLFHTHTCTMTLNLHCRSAKAQHPLVSGCITINLSAFAFYAQ